MAWLKHTLLILALAGLAGCASARLKDSHGYVPDDVLLADVRVGIDTKVTVKRLIGQPGSEGIIDDRGWYYVRSDYERFLWKEPVEVDRQVVAVTFTEKDVVANIERYGLKNGQVVRLSRRVTTSNTQGIGFLRQLFSNFGNFDAATLFGEN